MASQQMLPDVRQQSSYLSQPPMHQQVPQLGQPQVSVGYPQNPRKRRRPEAGELGLELGLLPGQAPEEQLSSQRILQSPQAHAAQQSSLGQSGYQLPGLQQHHHHLPAQINPAKVRRTGGGEVHSPGTIVPGPTSVVGQPGMPDPAPAPRLPKLKFTPEDDALLVDLKENKSLTWKQIADFFPGRSSGTLQVRYCTKLKAKATVWTEESIRRLRKALRDYEHDRWRIVASKVGSGFTPAACREKATELETEPGEDEQQQAHQHQQQQQQQQSQQHQRQQQQQQQDALPPTQSLQAQSQQQTAQQRGHD